MCSRLLELWTHSSARATSPHSVQRLPVARPRLRRVSSTFAKACQSSDTDPSRKRFWLSFKKRGTRHPRCTLFSTLFSSPCESLPGIRHQCAFAESVTWYLSDAITSRGRDFKPKSATELQCRENIAISADFVCCCRPGPIYSYIVTS